MKPFAPENTGQIEISWNESVLKISVSIEHSSRTELVGDGPEQRVKRSRRRKKKKKKKKKKKNWNSPFICTFFFFFIRKWNEKERAVIFCSDGEIFQARISDGYVLERKRLNIFFSPSILREAVFDRVKNERNIRKNVPNLTNEVVFFWCEGTPELAYIFILSLALCFKKVILRSEDKF